MDISDFDIYCISLNSRRDRWQESKEEFAIASIASVYRFPAIFLNDDPITSCMLSHYAVMELCENKHIMIFEDDVKFLHDKYTLDMCLKNLPEDWDMLYLGGNICKPFTAVNRHIGRLTHAQSTHAYCINKNFISKLLVYKKPHKHLDLIYTEEVIPNHVCYITIPMIAVQRPSYSDIEKKYVDYSKWMQERYNANIQWQSLKK